MSINPHRLKKGKQYIIKHHDTGKIYSGTFDFMTSIMIIMKNGDKKIQFMYDDHFYDLDDIREKARKARVAMEQRALNIILRTIVNENFEW
uniref:Uncharacterized protein n=1 Tax=viral metagenome TaxID=1070528 RepID=A0A6C0D1S1_9ZZZZ